MNWVKYEDVKIEIGKFYLVWTNGREWGDHHIYLWPAPMLDPVRRAGQWERGRPLYVAEVTDPTKIKEVDRPQGGWHRHLGYLG